MTERVVIIGSGPAGWAAAIYAARANLRPLVIEGAQTEENRIKGTLPLGQLALTSEVENYPGFPTGDLSAYVKSAVPADRFLADHTGHGITGPELLELMRQQAVNFGTRIITNDVTEIELSRHPFKMQADDGYGTIQQIEANAVIIATGARANYLGLPSEETYKNNGVSACAVCDGALPRFRNQPLIVVGGGDSAMEEATYLTHFASQVYLVHRRDSFRASKIMADRVLANPKINIKWNSVVDEVLGNEKQGVTGARIRNLLTEQSEEVAAGGYFAAIGHTPNTDFLKGQLKLTDKKYLVWTTPHRTYTSVEGVFASGDVADDYYRQAITAAGTGCMAALDAERWLALKNFH